ncbi:MAG: type II toxin-antitoxin system VapB family antitoxin [Longimicrobiales bacterium]
MNIDQAKLDRVRELLGIETETEAVDQALSALILREELIAGVRSVAGTGGVENVFENDVEP